MCNLLKELTFFFNLSEQFKQILNISFSTTSSIITAYYRELMLKPVKLFPTWHQNYRFTSLILRRKLCPQIIQLAKATISKLLLNPTKQVLVYINNHRWVTWKFCGSCNLALESRKWYWVNIPAKLTVLRLWLARTHYHKVRHNIAISLL